MTDRPAPDSTRSRILDVLLDQENEAARITEDLYRLAQRQRPSQPIIDLHAAAYRAMMTLRRQRRGLEQEMGL